MHAGKNVTFRIVLWWEFIVHIRSVAVLDYPAFVTIRELLEVFNGHCPQIAIYAASCCCSSSTPCSCVDICNTNTSNSCTVTGWLSCRNSQQFNLSLRIGRFSWPFLRELKSQKALIFCWVFWPITCQLLIQLQDLEHSTTVAQLNSTKEKREQQHKHIQCAHDTYYMCTVDCRPQRKCRVVRKSRGECILQIACSYLYLDPRAYAQMPTIIVELSRKFCLLLGEFPG